MNELLQKHGCSNVFTIPAGLKELMADITREVLRDQPPKIFDFIANYLSVLLITREHGVMAVKILDDLCDCKPSVSEHLLQLGFERKETEMLSTVIKEEIEGFEPVEGKEKVREVQILKKILTRSALDEDMSAKVCQVARNAYRDYWYRKKLMEKSFKVSHDEPWEIAAQHTLEIYKKTKPSFSELTRATEKIQAAYRGYYVRRNFLRHLKRKKRSGPKVELPGPPLDIAASREIDLGPVIDIKVIEDNVGAMFDNDAGKKLGLQYDPMRTITHVIDDEEFLEENMESRSTTNRNAMHSIKMITAVILVHVIKYRSIARNRNASLPVPEELGPSSDGSEFEGGEASELTPATEGETQEIPEDISEFIDGEESIPATSVPSSAPETDVEDTVGEVTTGEEEA
ncbi:hypothetical protein K1T71_009087 [Dendrolimus kikuchii]|uniref:Uncharacterized protein n=1 Tax=Dendrolimus kikuchii TaxID=765133 RepID=A0ACC1CTG4_9NEOP|nr:hypothetical protein K1T71_009087 [Dendrolimus kikuchii]